MMKFSNLSTPVLFALLAIASWSAPANAQIGGTGQTGTGQTGTATTDATTGGAGTGGAGIQTEPDTSAFDQIQRGDSVTAAATTGFGPAATQGTGGASAFGGGGGGFGGFGGLGGLGGLFGGGLGGGTQSTKPTIRTRLRSAVEVAPRSVSEVQMNANDRIVQLPQRQGLQNVQINMVGRTAIIEGTATTDRDRRMAELLMRLEPGVSQIQNNVIVSQ
ncbi:MAG: BON domain-containing protein [Pirellulaceae bacterium]